MKLKRVLKNKYLFENGLTLSLGSELINKYDLKRREELSHEEYLKVLELAALSTSYYYLSKRDYTRKELYLKLIQKYWEKSIVINVLNKLINDRVIDDFEFALNYVKNKKASRKKIEYDLKLKGIELDVIKEILENFNEDDELNEISKAWDKLGNKEEHKKIASLMRKGFSYTNIKKVIQIKGEEEC